MKLGVSLLALTIIIVSFQNCTKTDVMFERVGGIVTNGAGSNGPTGGDDNSVGNDSNSSGDDSMGTNDGEDSNNGNSSDNNVGEDGENSDGNVGDNNDNNNNSNDNNNGSEDNSLSNNSDDGDPSDGDNNPPEYSEEDLAAAVCSNGKQQGYLICHFPPGNSQGSHTLCVGRKAVDAHLKHNHSDDPDHPRDVLGSCN